MPARLTAVILTILLLLVKREAIARSRTAGDSSLKNHEGNGDHDSDGNGGGHFDYKAPSDWTTYFKACGGYRQSPIDVTLQNIDVKDHQLPLNFYNYENWPLEMTISNNGHSVQLSGKWLEDSIPSIYGGPLDGHYEFAQVHFHWGADNYAGSEHTVSNQSYPLEMHMVHYKKAYGNLPEALKHNDGVAVLGFFLSIDNNVNTGIENMKSGLSTVLKPGDSTPIDPFPLYFFNIQLEEGYVTYSGSLTTPPCTESVIWILCARIKDVTISELEAFRKVQLNHGDDHNYRPAQPLNGRKVHYVNIR